MQSVSHIKQYSWYHQNFSISVRVCGFASGCRCQIINFALLDIVVKNNLQWSHGYRCRHFFRVMNSTWYSLLCQMYAHVLLVLKRYVLIQFYCIFYPPCWISYTALLCSDYTCDVVVQIQWVTIYKSKQMTWRNLFTVATGIA